MDKGMGWLLSLGWFLLGIYLIALLVLSGAIAVFEAVRANFRRWTIHEPSRVSREA